MKPFLNKIGVITIDPTDKPIDIGREDFDQREQRALWKKSGDYNEFSKCMKEIRRIDLRFVDVSDFMVVFIDTDIYAWGTIEEISLANRQKKPCLVWCKQGKVNAPDWLFGQIPHQHIFNTKEELYSYLEGINSGTIEDSSKRWVFIKPKMLYNVEVLNILNKGV